MNLIQTLRENAGLPSYRKMGEETGIKFNRIMDLLKHRNGTPTLHEFIALCLLFDRNPAECLRTVMEQARARPAISPPPSPMVDDDRESRVEATLRQFKNDPLTLAANHSPYKYDGTPDTDDIA